MQRFSNILLVNYPDVDNSGAFQSAWALSHNNQARLTVVGTVDGPASNGDDALRQALLAEQSEQLEELVNSATPPGIDVEKRVLRGDASIESVRDVIPGYARSIHADLIMGTVGQTSISGFSIGISEEAILQQIDYPVPAVKPAGFKCPVSIDDTE